MSKHLPECLMNLEYAVRVCICPELRVCEKRVLDAIDLPAANVQYQKVGYADGLDAAREAVAAVEQDPDAQVDYHRDYEMDQTGNTRNPRAWLRSSLAAIDALKEKK